MTEAEWLACEEPRALIEAVCVRKLHAFYELGRFVGLVRQNRTERRYRLFACACMQRVRHLLPGPNWEAVECAERYADGGASLTDLRAARARIETTFAVDWVARLARRLPTETLVVRPEAAGCGVTRRDARLAAYSAVSEASALLLDGCSNDTQSLGRDFANLFRDVFGNPFRPVNFSPEWRTEPVVSLAARVYETRDFCALPILADALQDAGCDNDDVLDHCRGSGSHVRGCWVVDLALGTR